MTSKEEITVSNIVLAANTVYSDNPVMAKLAAAQAVLESGLQDGTPSGLAANHNNLFGIKGSGTAGSARLMTTEHEGGHDVSKAQNFASNATLEDSFRQHRALMEKERYAKVENADSLAEAAQEVKRAGYATDPKYAEKLLSTYNKYVAPVDGGAMEEYRASWLKVLKSSPDHVAEELEALDSKEAKALIDGVKKGDTKALDKAVDLLVDQADEMLKREGEDVTGRTLTIAQMLGGKTAVRLLQANAKDGTAKLNSVVTDEKQLSAIGKLLDKDVGTMTIAEFLGAVDEKGKEDKKKLLDKNWDNLSDENKKVAKGLLDRDMSPMEFFMTMIMVLVMNALGIDTGPMFGEKEKQAPTQSTEVADTSHIVSPPATPKNAGTQALAAASRMSSPSPA